MEGLKEPFAILSDIHANSAALAVCLEEIDRRGIKRLLCLGDLVGYNADPVVCLKWLADRGAVCIRGNHDRYVAGEQIDEVRESTIQAVRWTQKTLSDPEMARLRELPDERAWNERFLMVHGSVRDRDEYILSSDAAYANLRAMEERFPEVRVCFFGHCHLPMVVGANLTEIRFHETRTVPLDREGRYLVNPGSVGQPRDRCPLTSFAVFEPADWSVTVVRLPYDIAKTQAQVRQAGLDEGLARRLELGM